ncbi:hypothetical protein BBK82_30475 [Lentzea guizhouensis]|uniref:NADPH-dependent FMN reductase-like domain-containing protein n=1 Tax=Lentzea guizhouensis TaxID=1586287 RepID=A0A1B2HPS2_9PSEU|nr:NADPH-dependent FMN reductase [Lentzea guizhouensis]ANZ39727.1 hypothetical protein BBK82_30475 [Lentzea guizhouensis]
MTALVLAGAATRVSRSGAVAAAVCREVRLRGGDAVLWDLTAQPLPLLGSGPCTAVDSLRRLVQDADMLVWVTPCYHGSYSGLLKNCLDHLSTDDLRGKPVGVVTVGASLAAITASEHLRTVARALGCVTTPTQVVVTGSGHHDPGFAPEHERLADMVAELRVLTSATLSLRRSAGLDVLPLAE